jgi:hypothetical protein
MNSFRSLVYLPGGANATRVFCRDSGLVQGDFATAIQSMGSAQPHSLRGEP